MRYSLLIHIAGSDQKAGLFYRPMEAEALPRKGEQIVLVGFSPAPPPITVREVFHLTAGEPVVFGSLAVLEPRRPNLLESPNWVRERKGSLFDRLVFPS